MTQPRPSICAARQVLVLHSGPSLTQHARVARSPDSARPAPDSNAMLQVRPRRPSSLPLVLILLGCTVQTAWAQQRPTALIRFEATVVCLSWSSSLMSLDRDCANCLNRTRSINWSSRRLRRDHCAIAIRIRYDSAAPRLACGCSWASNIASPTRSPQPLESILGTIATTQLRPPPAVRQELRVFLLDSRSA